MHNRQSSAPRSKPAGGLRAFGEGDVAEQIDIYDANLGRIGVMGRGEAHRAGHWHRAFHCWVYTRVDDPCVLFQLRSPRSKNFPNMLDVSAAGHLTAGETVLDGVREVREELGISFDDSALAFAGERVEVTDQSNGQLNREYQSVYFLNHDADLAEYAPEPREVAGLFWIPLAAGLDFFGGRRDTVDLDGVEFDNGRYAGASRTVTRADFVPRIQRYYLAAMVSVDRLIDGKQDIAIS
jgi:isopentenyldiphosphate isomerase